MLRLFFNAQPTPGYCRYEGMQTIKDSVAYITGGTKGIGFGVAASIMKEGGHAVITSRSQAAADKAAAALNDKGFTGKALGVEADVRNLESQHKAIELAKATFGKVNVVIANAGVGHFAPIQDLTSEQWAETIDINLTGVFNTAKAGMDELIAHQGYLLTIASLAGTNFFTKGAAYNASKFGLVGFTQAVMLDLRKHGVKVSTIMPGSVATHFNDHTPSAADAWKIQPEDIGQMVVDLLKMPARTLPSKVEVRPSMPG